MSISHNENSNGRLARTVLERGCIYLLPLLFLLGFASAATAQNCTNAWTTQTAASGTGTEITVVGSNYTSLDLKLTGFTGHVYIFAGDVSGRLHQIYDGDYSVGTTTCPAAAGIADPCRIVNLQAHTIFRIDFARTAGTLNSADICRRQF